MIYLWVFFTQAAVYVLMLDSVGLNRLDGQPRYKKHICVGWSRDWYACRVTTPASATISNGLTAMGSRSHTLHIVCPTRKSTNIQCVCVIMSVCARLCICAHTRCASHFPFIVIRHSLFAIYLYHSLSGLLSHISIHCINTSCSPMHAYMLNQRHT